MSLKSCVLCLYCASCTFSQCIMCVSSRCLPSSSSSSVLPSRLLCHIVWISVSCFTLTVPRPVFSVYSFASCVSSGPLSLMTLVCLCCVCFPLSGCLFPVSLTSWSSSLVLVSCSSFPCFLLYFPQFSQWVQSWFHILCMSTFPALINYSPSVQPHSRLSCLHLAPPLLSTWCVVADCDAVELWCVSQ